MADLLARGRPTASASLRAQYGTEMGKKQLNALLNILLSPGKCFNEETKEWCLWLISGGESPEVFLDKLRVYDSSQACGLVWHKNFVAYRCRDCGTSPCMSICADCFHGGDHQGHDYNMFRSQAGGACDCGDENVMKKEGFCSSHGKMNVASTPPNDVLYMARAVIPHLFNRIYKEVKPSSNSEDSITTVNDDIDKIVQFLQELCKGEVIRSVICDVIVQEYQDLTQSNTDITYEDSETSLCQFPQDFATAVYYQEHVDCCEKEPINYLELLLDIVIKLDFPEKLVTFLLQLLPNQQYKVAFTLKFCQKYQEIGKALTMCSTLQEVEQLSNSVVHISVQLFSNQVLVAKMVTEQKLLHVMIKVIQEMVRTTFQPMKVNDQIVGHLVVDCDKSVIRYHCYWPVISDLINVLSHDSIASIFMQDIELIEKWMTFLACITGMNGNKRVISRHVEYEPVTYNAAYSIEIEAAAAPMWSLIAASSVLNNKGCLMNIFHHAAIALNKWLKEVSLKPSRCEVVFHLPLLRYLTAFVRQGMSQFNMRLQDFRWDFSLLTRILEWPTSIQAAVCEIRAGLWVRNGHQIQVQSSWYQQCHFCNSMFDLDLFFMQICAAQLDPDYFLSVLLNRFRVHDWFQFRPKMKSNPGIDDDVKEMMVDGVLILIVTLLTCRLHFDMKEEEILRLEMVTTLCFADRTHSQLVNMVPERSGQALNTQLFEKILKEISDYKNPGCDSSGMQQGMYTLKQHIWDTDFDPVHAMIRAFNRSEFQSAMGRYTAHVRQRDSSNVSSLWPPFRPLKPVPESFNGIFRLLHCKKLHQMLYFILYKATSSVTPVSESIIYLTIHLITLAIQSRPSLFQRLPSSYEPSTSDVSDTGCLVVSKCLNFLNTYGKDIKNLHRDEDFSKINKVLFSKIYTDPEATLNPNQVSVREISLILGHTLHYRMEPPLFSSILPYMNTVLSNVLNNSCSQSERESQLRHIQFLLETLPVHRYNVVKMLIAYLVKFIEREDILLKNISIIFDDSQPLELTMLFMYLIKYHEQLFRVYQPLDGFPRDISSLEFPSHNLVENIRYEPRIISESENSRQVKTPEDYMPVETSVSSTSTLTSSSQNSETLIQEFIEITNASIDTAIYVLEQCQKHLETAVNIYFESNQSSDETLSESSSNMAMDIEHLESDLDTSAPWFTRENLCFDQANVSRNGSVAGGHLTDSILSLLMKLKTVLSLSVSSPLSPRCPGITMVNDGVRKLEKLLEIISQSSSSNVEAICKLDPPACSLAPTNYEDPLEKQELKRKRARERQQRLMDEFASKQQEFLKNVCEQDESEEVDSVCCKRSLTELFDCAICGQQSIPSSEEEPMGYVVFLQSGSVLKHRRRSDCSTMLYVLKEGTSTDSYCCGSVYAARKKFLSTYFNKVAATQASELGIDGGVRIQSCGHCLHLKCQQSYLQCLTEEQQSTRHQSRAFDPTKGEFVCPVCRRLGNAILPILPSEVMTPTCNKSKEKCHQEVMAELEMTLKNCCSDNWTRLTNSALKLSALSASISSLVENINRLDLNKEKDHNTISQNKFSLIVETARSNLEAEHIVLQSGKLFCKRMPFYGTLLRTLQYQSQTLVCPLIHVLALLTGKPIESFEVKFDTEATRNDVPLLLRDGVSLLLQLMLSWPAPLNPRSFRCLVQIVFNVVFIQALVKTCCTFTADERLSWQVLAKKFQEKRQTGLTTEMLLGFVCSQLGDSKLCQESQECPGISQSVWSPHTVENTVQKLCLPFLRMVTSLSTLCYSTDRPDVQNEENEFFLLTLSLGLHQKSCSQSSSMLSVSDCFKYPHGCPLFLVKMWCKQLCAISRSHEIFPKDLIPGTDEWQAPRLFPLPKTYDSLFQTYRKSKCLKCGTTPDEPTLCLVCGTFVCLRGRCCEREGIRECVEHAMKCGYGTAVFLIMMSSSIFVIRGEKASVWGSVYLDEFGEEDIDLRRGKPLFLSTERYQRLEEQWITHTFDNICKTWMSHNNNL